VQVLLCQAAQYNVVIVETVGLGQSEVEVEQTVDVLLLLLPPAGGDDLQVSTLKLRSASSCTSGFLYSHVSYNHRSAMYINYSRCCYYGGYVRHYCLRFGQCCSYASS
jgi:Methylmalonyl Co-A mutase-associated GTPase MeaB